MSAPAWTDRAEHILTDLFGVVGPLATRAAYNGRFSTLSLVSSGCDAVMVGDAELTFRAHPRGWELEVHAHGLAWGRQWTADQHWSRDPVEEGLHVLEKTL